MSRSFLPPRVEDLFPSFKPDKNHLAALEDNLFFREYLSLLHRQLFSHRERLGHEKTDQSLDFRRGQIAGFDETLQILETLRDKVENPPDEVLK